eukprot:9698-Heterococcus_DN1.PRE.6
METCRADVKTPVLRVLQSTALHTTDFVRLNYPAATCVDSYCADATLKHSAYKQINALIQHGNRWAFQTDLMKRQELKAAERRID